MLSDFQQTLAGIQSASSDDCVRLLTENGKEFGETRDQVRKLRESLNPEAIGVLRQARQAIDQVWDRLSAHAPSDDIEKKVNQLRTLLASEKFVESWNDIVDCTQTVLGTYRTIYCKLYDDRKKSYESAIDEIQNRTEWETVHSANSSLADSVLSSLQARMGNDEDRALVQAGKSIGKSSLTEMQSDLAAVDALKSSALVKLQELAIGSDDKKPVRRVRMSEFLHRPIETQQELEKILKLIRDSLQKCIDEGVVIILE
jgi:negative regulator of replication initiation